MSNEGRQIPRIKKDSNKETKYSKDNNKDNQISKRYKRNKNKAEVISDNQIHIKENSIPSNMLYTWKGALHVQKKLVFMLPILIFSTALHPYLILYMQKFIIQYIEEQAPMYQFYKMMGIATILYFLLSIPNTLITNQLPWRSLDVRMNFMVRKNRKVMTMDYVNLERPEVLDLSRKATRALESPESGVEGLMTSTHKTVVCILNVFTGIAILSIFNPLIALLLIGLSVVCYFILDRTKSLDKIHVWDFLAPTWRKEYYIKNVMTNFDSAKDIRLYSMKKWLIIKFHEVQDIIIDRMINCRNRWMKASIAMQIVGFIQGIVVTSWLIYAVLRKGLSVADYSLYSGTVVTVFVSLSNVFNVMTDLRNQSRQMDDLRTFLEFPDQVREDIIPLPKFDTYEFIFDHVSFRYPGSEQWALQDLSIRIKPGERLAVVGMNGAGKSTFIKLLCRLYSLTEGTG